MIGTSDEKIKVKELIMRIAPHDTTVLITGETGTGKEIVAILIKQSKKENLLHIDLVLLRYVDILVNYHWY